jgi:hypothetical protein
MTEKDKIIERLAQAEEAYHKLMLGEKEASVNVGDFGSVSYSQANIDKLERYIAILKRQLNGGSRKPIYMKF